MDDGRVSKDCQLSTAIATATCVECEAVVTGRVASYMKLLDSRGPLVIICIVSSDGNLHPFVMFPFKEYAQITGIVVMPPPGERPKGPQGNPNNN